MITARNADQPDSVIPFPGIQFQQPLPGKLSLSGTFGELRPDHYHSGIDIRTGGKEGVPVLAAAGGFISRIKISNGGFGLVIYINHPQGYTTVYGHLHAFTPAISVLMDSIQHASRQYNVEYFPDSSRYPVKAGDVIGLSGNSGSSEAPHLHFEIRERFTEEPLNPLLTGWIHDTVAPQLVKVYWYKKVSDHWEFLKVFPVSSSTDTVQFDADSLGIAILSYDPDSLSKTGIYSGELYVNDSLIFSFRWNRFNFDESKYVNAHIDYAWLKQTGERIHRLYRLPGDSCSMLINSGNGNIIMHDQVPVSVSVLAGDFNGNKTTASFILLKSIQHEVKKTTREAGKWLPVKYDKPFTFSFNNKAKISFVANSLYQDDSLFIPAKQIKPVSSMLSAPFGVFNPGIALKKVCTYALPLPPQYSKSKQLIFCELSKTGSVISSQPVTVKNNMALLLTRKLAVFALSIDSLPPVPGLITEYFDSLSSSSYIRVKLYDDASGINSASVLVNGSWAPALWDERFHWLQIPIPAQRPLQLIISLTDGCSNSAQYEILI